MIDVMANYQAFFTALTAFPAFEDNFLAAEIPSCVGLAVHTTYAPIPAKIKIPQVNILLKEPFLAITFSLWITHQQRSLT